MTSATSGKAGRLCVALVAVLAALFASPAWAAAAGEPPPIDADAAILVDASSGKTIYAENENERHAIASTTKLMTALLALERADFDDVFTAPAYPALAVESTIGLAEGERMAVRDLLRALSARERQRRGRHDRRERLELARTPSYAK